VKLSVVGISHHVAPVELRERVALPEADAAELARALGDAVCLSTCNRTEIYLSGDHEERALGSLERIAGEPLGGVAYRMHDEAAAVHLFRVAAGLDSLVPGESEILGQVRSAYEAVTPGPLLDHVFRQALSLGKRVRSETDIGRGASSLSQVAVELVAKIFTDLKGRSILLVGAGKMGALSAKALASLGADRVLVTNRSHERAVALAQQTGGAARSWAELDQLLVEADVVIVSTGAPSYVVNVDMAHATMKARRHRSACYIDLSVPRNVDPRCAELENLYAYDVDDLQKVVHATRSARAGEALRGEAIVEAEMMAFFAEREVRAALPVLAALRRRAEEIALAEAERTLTQVGARLDEKGRRSVEAMARAIVNKLLHGPTARLKQAASSGDSTLPGAAAELFGIEDDQGQAAREQPARTEEPAGRADNVVAISEKR